MLTPARIWRSLRFRYQHWRGTLPTEAEQRRTAMMQSLRRNRELLRELHRLQPGRRIVAIMLIEHFGDIVACEPVIPYLRRQHPDDHLLWIVREPYRELLLFHPALDSTISVTCLTEALELVREAQFDRFVDLHVNHRRCTWFGTTHKKSGGDPTVTVDNYLEFGPLLEAFSRSAGLPPLRETPRLYLPPGVGQSIDLVAPVRPFIVLHAGANETSRNWMTEKWAELIASLRDRYSVTLVEVGLRPLIANRGVDIIDLCGKLSLTETAELVRRATGFIGVESGPAHLANAFARPSVVLMGRYRRFTHYEIHTGFFRDHADHMLIKWDGLAANIPVALVLRHVEQTMGTMLPRSAPDNAQIL